MESKPEVETGARSRIHRVTLTTIYDPQANVAYTLNEQMKTALTRSMRISATGAKGPIPGTAPTRPPLKLGVSDGSPAWTQEDLGIDSIEGFQVVGHRVTRTIPAGEMGNEQPMTVTTETWFSPDMKMIMREKRTDPRLGEMDSEVTNIVRGEPDASMFQVPADYTVEDAPAPRIGGGFTTKQ